MSDNKVSVKEALEKLYDLSLRVTQSFNRVILC